MTLAIKVRAVREIHFFFEMHQLFNVACWDEKCWKKNEKTTEMRPSCSQPRNSVFFTEKCDNVWRREKQKPLKTSRPAETKSKKKVVTDCSNSKPNPLFSVFINIYKNNGLWLK